MDWTEVAITVDAADVDRAGDIAQMVVPYGIYIEDYSHLEEEAWEIAHIDLIDEVWLDISVQIHAEGDDAATADDFSHITGKSIFTTADVFYIHGSMAEHPDAVHIGVGA